MSEHTESLRAGIRNGSIQCICGDARRRGLLPPSVHFEHCRWRWAVDEIYIHEAAAEAASNNSTNEATPMRYMNDTTDKVRVVRAVHIHGDQQDAVHVLKPGEEVTIELGGTIRVEDNYRDFEPGEREIFEKLAAGGPTGDGEGGETDEQRNQRLQAEHAKALAEQEAASVSSDAGDQEAGGIRGATIINTPLTDEERAQVAALGAGAVSSGDPSVEAVEAPTLMGDEPLGIDEVKGEESIDSRNQVETSRAQEASPPADEATGAAAVVSDGVVSEAPAGDPAGIPIVDAPLEQPATLVGGGVANAVVHPTEPTNPPDPVPEPK